MSLAMNFYESEIEITEDHLKKLVNYFNDKDNPTEVSLFREGIIEGRHKYQIFRIAKEIERPYQTYVIEDEKVVPSEETHKEWDNNFAYIKVGSKQVYVEGNGRGWVANFISNILFESEDQIKLIEIDIKKLEEDIVTRSKFKSIGVGFVDPDGTRVKLTNFGGLDLEENKHTKGCGNLMKDHIDILIEKDDLQLKVLIYLEGKVTFLGYKQDRSVALRIFLKIWDEIKGYS